MEHPLTAGSVEQCGVGRWSGPLETVRTCRNERSVGKTYFVHQVLFLFVCKVEVVEVYKYTDVYK